MNQIERRECVFELYENNVNFEIFDSILKNIGNHVSGVGQATISMKIDDWVKHYEKYAGNLKITKEQLIITFDCIEKYYDGYIKKISPKIDNIYFLENKYQKIDFTYEYETLKIIQLFKNK